MLKTLIEFLPSLLSLSTCSLIRFARGKVDDIQLEYGTKRYHEETKRLLTVLDKQLEGKEYLVANQLTIADVANFTWVGIVPLVFVYLFFFLRCRYLTKW